MDEWEFFQNARGAWRWRCISADATVVRASGELYLSRADAVADAIEHGYAVGAVEVEPDRTFVDHRGLEDDDSAERSAVRQSGYNPYDTGRENLKPGRRRS
jgi:uncharacterized protein YegP (UPF0339 family)